MINLPTIPVDLVSIVLDDNSIVFKECTLDYAKDLRKNKGDFILLGGALMTSARIRHIDWATDLDKFEIFVFPKMSVTVKQDFRTIRHSAKDQKQNPSLSAILHIIEKKKEEREYALSMDRVPTPEELKRRKEQADQLKKRLSFSIS
jgi:radical SAM superfamily enzyme YgiQ (UPF0313 family)